MGRGLELPRFMGKALPLPPPRPAPLAPPPLPERNVALDAAVAVLPENYVRGYSLEPQDNTLWCWAAVGDSIARLYNAGGGWSQCRLANKLRHGPAEQALNCCGAGKAGCNWMRPMEEVFAQIGHSAGNGGELPFETLCREIDGQRPVCVRLTWGGNSGHVVVVTGYRRNGGENLVTVHDPRSRASAAGDEMLFEDLQTYYNNYASQWTHSYLTQRGGGRPWS